ncbi:hypothetical protein ACFL2T_04145 [Elusimicrobiota bacterium]
MVVDEEGVGGGQFRQFEEAVQEVLHPDVRGRDPEKRLSVQYGFFFDLPGDLGGLSGEALRSLLKPLPAD